MAGPDALNSRKDEKIFTTNHTKDTKERRKSEARFQIMNGEGCDYVDKLFIS
jgi:hypothetical protein